MEKREVSVERLVLDAFLVILSVVVAVAMVWVGVASNLVIVLKSYGVVGSFFSGIFLVSIFTAAPATVVLGELARSHSLFGIALVGSFGSLFGDLLIFNFVKGNIAEDCWYIIEKLHLKRLVVVFDRQPLRWLLILIGVVIWVLPLPDEIAMTIFGLKKMKARYFIPLGFLINFFTICMIGLISRRIG